MATFKAVVIDKGEAGQTVRLTDIDENNLMDGDVTVAVEYSTVNYKDGLAVTGKAPVVRRFPMIAGVDFAGTVESSAHPRWKAGDQDILNRSELTGAVRPLAKERWAAGIDVVGSTTLANVLSMTRYGGAVAACGLAGGMDLPSTVAPFILRGVSLLGIDSVMRPLPDRRAAWGRLAAELDRAKLTEMS